VWPRWAWGKKAGAKEKKHLLDGCLNGVVALFAELLRKGKLGGVGGGRLNYIMLHDVHTAAVNNPWCVPYIQEDLRRTKKSVGGLLMDHFFTIFK